MKKILKIFAFAVIALAALASCAKEQFKENTVPAGEKILVSINGQIGELTPADATKATAGSVVRVTWEQGDKVFVYDGSDDPIGTLIVTPDEKNASYALLSGEITGSEASPSKLTLVYVKGETEAPAIAGGKISIDLSAQDQKDVPFVLYSTIDYDAAKLSKANEYISFSFATSVMTVNCTGLPTDEGTKIDITKAEIDGVSTACELTVTGSGVTVAGASKGTITRSETATPSVFTQSDSRGSFILALAADPETPAARNILVYQDSKVYGAPFTQTTLTGNKSYNTVYQLGEYIKYVTTPTEALPGEFTVNNDGKKVYFSKGNLWYGNKEAESNAALHFEDAQSSSSGSDGHVVLFNWSSTIEKAVGNSPAGEFFFCDENHKQAIDGSEGLYYALSYLELKYLFEHHSYKWSSVNGVNGLVIAPDDFDGSISDTYADDSELTEDNLVFLPAAGMFNPDGNFFGGRCNYWMSTPISLNNTAWMMRNDDSNKSKAVFDGGSVKCKYSVRLVTEAAGGYSPAVKVTGVTLNKNNTEIEAGTTETLVATVSPANATHKEVTWSSSDETIATVDKTTGEVTGVAAGSAVITATTSDGNFTAACLVTVTSKPLALPGVFSVADGKTVHFSKGNLQATYNSGTEKYTWGFAEKQYDFIGNGAGNTTINAQTDGAVVDLFGWSTEKTNYGISTSTDRNGYPGEFVDWGETIDNVGTWYTLSIEEWNHLFNVRASSSVSSTNNARYAKATVNKIDGVILLPDIYEHPSGVTNLKNINSGNSAFSNNDYGVTDWEAMESAGAIFLPVAGSRVGASCTPGYGYCWSSTPDPNDVHAQYVRFQSDEVTVPGGNVERYYGLSVRLVTEVK